MGILIPFNSSLPMKFIPTLTTLLACALPLNLFAAAEKTEAKDTASKCSCCCATSPTEEEAESWAIRGVVESVLTERNALLVKHEEIPGFMRAMTMMFQVDASLLEAIEEGDNITATMKRAQPRGWLLENVKITDS